ncbi:MAG: AbrB/MazE/SpoVT family DNA-binding domain-containing protein [Coriobacteriia bacterium]
MPNAKITSKGQVTIPIEVRQALGLKQGDMLAFEVQAEYVVVRKRPTLAEVLEKHKDLLPKEEDRVFADDDEAVAAYFDEMESDDLSDTLIVLEVKKPYRGGSR